MSLKQASIQTVINKINPPYLVQMVMEDGQRDLDE